MVDIMREQKQKGYWTMKKKDGTASALLDVWEPIGYDSARKEVILANHSLNHNYPNLPEVESYSAEEWDFFDEDGNLVELIFDPEKYKKEM